MNAAGHVFLKPAASFLGTIWSGAVVATDQSGDSQPRNNENDPGMGSTPRSPF